MLLSKKSKNNLRWHSATFIVLLLGIVVLLAYLSQRYNYQADLTSAQRHSLSQTSLDLLATLEDTVLVKVYATDTPQLREAIRRFINRYQQAYPDIKMDFVNPDLEPDLIRNLGIRSDGEAIVHYQGRQEHLHLYREQEFSNVLQRLARSQERWLIFVAGHGERKPNGEANHDLGQWGKTLEQKGFKLQNITLSETPAIPDNTALLVIASPQLDYLPGETAIIRKYLELGGNLLWLAEPNDLHQLEPLAEFFGIQWLPGTIVDPNTRALNIKDPRMSLVSQYAQHDATRDFTVLTLFPLARGIKHQTSDQWQATALLQSSERSWAETGVMQGQISQGDSDIAGPLTIGLALQRELKVANNNTENTSKKQRIVLLGDGDFLSNTYIGNGGNLDLGSRLVNWLSHDDVFIQIPVRTAEDISLQLSTTQQTVIALVFWLLLPLVLAGSGFTIWWRRRAR